MILDWFHADGHFHGVRGTNWRRFISNDGTKNMRDTILKLMIQLRHDDRAVTLVEYGIALTLAVGFGVAALTGLGTAIAGSMGSAALQMP